MFWDVSLGKLFELIRSVVVATPQRRAQVNLAGSEKHRKSPDPANRCDFIENLSQTGESPCSEQRAALCGISTACFLVQSHSFTLPGDSAIH